MPHHGILRDYKFKENADDIRGADVYGRNNEKLGEIDDVIFDHAEMNAKYVVLDSGGWLESKKFLVPAGLLRGSERGPNAFQVGLAKENINRFPPYQERVMQSEKDWSDYEQNYMKSWRHACDIGGTELAITGQMDELCLSPADWDANTSNRPERWSRFQNVLQRDRTNLQQHCSICGGESKVA
jgi:hypothetical protein